jgi:diguanylate cyclase (GGDEF)-like protein
VLEFLVASLNHELTRSHAALAYGWDGARFTDLVRGGLPDVLCGGVAGPAVEPWAMAMTAREIAVHPTRSTLPGPLAREAVLRGLEALWIAPVRVRPNDPPTACIAIWRDVEGDPWVSHRASLARAVRLTALAFERRHTEQLLRHAALHDTLTGVANRAQFFERLGSLPAAEVRQHSRAAVLYLDLDGFKAVNDTYGHHAGDVVLQAVTDRMLAAVRSDDLVARLGGDEFAVLCVDVTNVEQATALADRLIHVTAEPIDVGGAEVSVGVSIGIALASVEDVGSASLLDAADRALYVAKHEGKSCWRLAS